jgi:hypothetical protein
MPKKKTKIGLVYWYRKQPISIRAAILGGIFAICVTIPSLVNQWIISSQPQLIVIITPISSSVPTISAPTPTQPPTNTPASTPTPTPTSTSTPSIEANEGLLMPSNEPDLPICDNLLRPEDYKIYFGGNAASLKWPQEEITVLNINGKRVVWLRWREEGVAVSANSYSEDGKIVAQVVDNEFYLNRKNEVFWRIRRPNYHELIVYDIFGEEMLRVRILNSTSIIVTGKFPIPGSSIPIVVTEESIITPDGKRYSGNCSRGTDTVFAFIYTIKPSDIKSTGIISPFNP